MNTLSQAVYDHLQRVINKILFLKKKDLFQFKGIKFYPAEIHLMLIIKDKSATNATKMAEWLGVTKGAVSQTMSRLENKGVLVKEKDPYNKNELTLTFTSFGTTALEFYSEIAKGMYQVHADYLDTFTKQEKEVIQRFLTGIESALKKLD